MRSKIRIAILLQGLVFAGCGAEPAEVAPDSIGQTALPLSEYLDVCGSCPTGYAETGRDFDFGCCDGWGCAGLPKNLAHCKCASAATCPPPKPSCDARSGTHASLLITVSAIGEYQYHDVWCTPNNPNKCMDGYFVKTSVLATQSCVPGVLDCTAPRAQWNVSCNWTVDCVYDCAGKCVLPPC